MSGIQPPSPATPSLRATSAPADLIESSGYSSVFGEGTLLEATQSYGTITTDEGTVPFRNNRASQGQLTVSGSVSGEYRRNLNAPQEPIEYEARPREYEARPRGVAGFYQHGCASSLI